jgi:RNA recognition motif-containing protein
MAVSYEDEQRDLESTQFNDGHVGVGELNEDRGARRQMSTDTGDVPLADSSASATSTSAATAPPSSASAELHSLFVGNLLDSFTEADVRAIIAISGHTAREINLKRGYAFVFVGSATRDELGDIAKRLNNATYKGTTIRVELAHGAGKQREATRRKRPRAEPTNTVFVANFGSGVSDDDVRKFFAGCGAIARVQVRANFGFVEFEQIESAQNAVDKLDDAAFINGRRLTVEFSGGSRGGGGGGGGQRQRTSRYDAQPHYGQQQQHGGYMPPGYGMPPPMMAGLPPMPPEHAAYYAQYFAAQAAAAGMAVPGVPMPATQPAPPQQPQQHGYAQPHAPFQPHQQQAAQPQLSAPQQPQYAAYYGGEPQRY